MNTTVTARYLSKGQRYLGRRDWHLTVESVTVHKSVAIVVSLNGFGEEVREHYPLNTTVELIEDRA